MAKYTHKICVVIRRIFDSFDNRHPALAHQIPKRIAANISQKNPNKKFMTMNLFPNRKIDEWIDRYVVGLQLLHLRSSPSHVNRWYCVIYWIWCGIWSSYNLHDILSNLYRSFFLPPPLSPSLSFSDLKTHIALCAMQYALVRTDTHIFCLFDLHNNVMNRKLK